MSTKVQPLTNQNIPDDDQKQHHDSKDVCINN